MVFRFHLADGFPGYRPRVRFGPLDNSSLNERNVLVSLRERIEGAPGDERDLAPALNQSLRLIAVPKVKEESLLELCRKIKLKI